MSKNSANTLNGGKAPAFQFYAADFDTATRSWLPEEVGVFIRLLCAQWNTGPLPIEHRRLSAIVGTPVDEFESIWKTVGQKFKESKDGLINQRLENIRLDQLNYRKKQSDSGKKGAAKRWPKDSSAISDPNSDAISDPTSQIDGDPNGHKHGQEVALRSSVSGLQTSVAELQSPDSTDPPYQDDDSTVSAISSTSTRVA